MADIIGEKKLYEAHQSLLKQLDQRTELLYCSKYY